MWKETIFQAAPSGDSVFQMEAAGISVCDETYHVCRAQSGMYLFEYVYRGQGTVHVNGVTCHPAAGDVYILPYGSSHEYYTIGKDQWHKVWFSANGPLIGQLLHSYRLEGVYHVPGCNQRALLFQMFSLVKYQQPQLHREGALLFHHLCLDLAQKTSPEAVNISPAALKIKQYLDANLRREVSIADIGRHIYKSPSQVIRIFKRAYGKTPYEYVVDERIRTAKMLLSNYGYMSVKEIAFSLNYSDEHYFSNHFKSRVGMSPTRYKQWAQESAMAGERQEKAGL